MIKIKNIFYMLSYAMVPLSESGYRKTDVEDFSHIEDLFAMILEKGTL